ncbi:condensation domain-containing protein [Streptomyces sp. NBC_00096]|uniref:condensation domain-containing protein n=1 Tax=Streptomyces sp. NBC_00096 TaxID=2975650 RepID=UPI00324DE5CE
MPLTPGQQRMWFTEQLRPADPAHVIQRAVRLRGALDVPALRQAFGLLLRRHDALRTGYRSTPAGVEQTVHPPTPAGWETMDLSAAPLPAGSAALWAERRRRRPADLRGGQVAGLAVLRLGPDDHLLLLTVHHIAFDGASTEVYLRELGTAYRAFADGSVPDLPPAPGHAQYAARLVAAEPPDPEHRRYWARALAGVRPVLALPHDMPPRAGLTSSAHAVRVDPGPDSVTRLRDLGREYAVTPFMVMLACYAGLLARCGADPDGWADVVVAVPSAGRGPRGAPDSLVGFVANLLPVRLNFSVREGLGALLRRTREACLAAGEHRLPYEQIVAASAVRRLPHRQSLAQVSFSLAGAPPVPDLGAGIKVTDWPLEPTSSRFELEMHLEHTADATHGLLLASADLFSRATAEALAAAYEDLTCVWSARPDIPLLDLPLPDPPHATPSEDVNHD